MKSYPAEIEQHMQRFYQTLSEKDRRRYAAIEARKLGYGGISYICQLFDCDYRAVAHGIEDFHSETALQQLAIRQPGGVANQHLRRSRILIPSFSASWPSIRQVRRWMKP